MRRRSKALAGVAVVVLVLVAAGLVLTLRDNARPVTVQEARSRTTTSVDPAGREQAPAAARPEPGVYRYEGGGTEALSTPPLSQSQGPEMPATVELTGDGCWSFRIDYSSNHWQDWEHCPEGDLVTEVGGSTWQRWMIGTSAITNLSTFVCEPGTPAFSLEPVDAQQWTGSCVGTSEAVSGQTVSEGPYVDDGEQVLEVGGVEVRTRRYVSERTMTGAQTGQERSTTWFAVESGLPVRNERTLEVRTDTPIGPSTYTESGWFQLTDLRPA